MARRAEPANQLAEYPPVLRDSDDEFRLRLLLHDFAMVWHHTPASTANPHPDNPRRHPPHGSHPWLALHDESQASDRRYLSEDSMSMLNPQRDSLTTAEFTAGNQHRGST